MLHMPILGAMKHLLCPLDIIACVHIFFCVMEIHGEDEVLFQLLLVAMGTLFNL
jgi:hypothetical protein